MKLTYDEVADAAYLYIKYPIKKGEAKKTIPFSENIILDFDAQGKLLGVEILSASKILNRKALLEAHVKNKRAKLTSSEKKELINMHVWHELKMFEYALRRWHAATMHKEAIVRSAVLELFLLHGRCLYEFFYRKPNDNFLDDVRAQDFFPEGKWKAIRPPHTKELKELWKISGYQLAHISRLRLLRNKPRISWHAEKISSDLRKAVLAFVSNLPHEDVGKELKDWQTETQLP